MKYIDDIDRLNNAIKPSIKGMKPPEKLTVSEWADKKRRLSAESSAETGSWRTSRTPYLKEIMNAFTQADVRHIAIVASSQVGKSECINNCIGYIIDQDPGSILFVQPTTIDAKEYSRLRIAPMIRDCPTLKRKVADAKARDSGNTLLQKTYPGGILTMCGSTEAHALASKPIRYVFGDERDRWATSAGGEGDPWELALARQTTFYNAKSVEVSTPTVKGASAIETAYNKGTMERYCTQCPHCSEYSEIVFNDIRFEYEEIKVDNKINYEIKSVYYCCPVCGGVSTEAEMKRQPAKWIADNPDALKIHSTRSFWLSSWVSPWAGWEDTLTKFLAARGDSRQMQVIYNTRFGQLWEDRGDLEDEDSVLSRREDYNAELPEGVLCLTCGIDTQDDRLEYEVVGYGHFGESWGIRKGIIMGRPDSPEVWEALDQVLEHRYEFADGLSLKISLAFMDEGGHFTMDVRYNCAKRVSKRLFAIKGRGGQDIQFISPPKKQAIIIDGKQYGMAQVFSIGVDSGKSIIMDNLRVRTAGPKYMHFPKREDYGKNYFTGLLSERLVYKKEAKHPWQWEKIPGHERNEALDCRNYSLAAVKALSPDFDILDSKLKEIRSDPKKQKKAIEEAKNNTVVKVKPPAPIRKRRKTTGGAGQYNEW